MNLISKSVSTLLALSLFAAVPMAHVSANVNSDDLAALIQKKEAELSQQENILKQLQIETAVTQAALSERQKTYDGRKERYGIIAGGLLIASVAMGFQSLCLLLDGNAVKIKEFMPIFGGVAVALATGSAVAGSVIYLSYRQVAKLEGTLAQLNDLIDQSLKQIDFTRDQLRTLKVKSGLIPAQ